MKMLSPTVTEKRSSAFENSISMLNINSCDNYNNNNNNNNEDNPSIYSRPYRNFRSNEEYLWAMKEDLAEWLNNLYDININADNFIEKLETGVILCRHANNVISKAISSGHKFDSKECSNNVIYTKEDELRYRSNAKPKTFQARDNVSNFIGWCKSLKIHECLLFETDDLVLGKNEKSFILCLLEVTRKCTAFGISAPLIVQLEQEIDRELDEERFKQQQQHRSSSSAADDDDEDADDVMNDTMTDTLSTSPDSGYMGSLTSNASSSDSSTFNSTTTTDTTNSNTKQSNASTGCCKKDSTKETSSCKSESQIITNNLKCLHERVVDLLNRCTCPSQFPMVKVADGKYRVGNPKVLIYVRILRNHVMVRVGGGWDTLGHYLDRHDPCRCRVGTKSAILANNNNNSNNNCNLNNIINTTPTTPTSNNNLKASLLQSNTRNTSSSTGQQIWVNYNRPYPAEPQYTSFDNLRCDSTSMLYPNLKRRDSVGLTESSCSLNSFSEGSDRQPSRSSQYSDDSASSSSSSTAAGGGSSISGGGSISPRSSISSSTGGLHHLSTGQLNSSSSSLSLHFHNLNHSNHHNHLLHHHHQHHNHHHLLHNHKIQPNNHSTTSIRDINSYKQINQRPGFSKMTRSGIAKYVGLANYQMPISTISKVNSCTNIRFCHQSTTPSTTPSKTIPRKI